MIFDGLKECLDGIEILSKLFLKKMKGNQNDNKNHKKVIKMIILALHYILSVVQYN